MTDGTRRRNTAADLIDAKITEVYDARGEQYLQRQGYLSRADVAELVSVCDELGIDPAKPSELLACRRNASTEYEDGVQTIVTAGGLKLEVRDAMRQGIASCTPETVYRLKLTFGCFYRTPKGEDKERPLPADLTLPREAVTGRPGGGQAPPYRGTYTSSDSAAEARRRERLAATQRGAGDQD